jgi:hypothetical protein
MPVHLPTTGYFLSEKLGPETTIRVFPLVVLRKSRTPAGTNE